MKPRPQSTPRSSNNASQGVTKNFKKPFSVDMRPSIVYIFSIRDLGAINVDFTAIFA